ncbi:sortase domain-bontaining protein, partial [Kocuria palustris]|uniref:sortase domain-containing protein n=1 Tax=Kocuria palustris TaxID=71999 RepID=UPI0028D81F5F
MISVISELLLTAGVLVLLYVVWQLWWTNIEAGSLQEEAVAGMPRSYDGPLEPALGDIADPSVVGESVVMDEGPVGSEIGVVYIPRLDEGNFAVAGHRQTNGAVLDHIDALTEGERIHVRTADGYYTYLYSETLIVLPTQTDEIAPVPGEPGEPADGGCMTLTSCNPRFGDTERIIVHAQLESWRPNSAGPPP